MMKPKQQPYQNSRRRFLKQTGGLSALAATGATLPISSALASPSSSHSNVLRDNPLGFNGVRRDPVTKLYPLGHGYRMYSPTLMRFNAQDSLSPFGRGGVNGYAYCLGDPINRHDPSGHIALLSLLIGAIVGAVVGAAVSAAAEGIQMAINPEHKFDWKQVGIGAAVGFITGGIGIAAAAPKTEAQLGLAIAKSAAVELASVPISTVSALAAQPNASKGLQIFGKIVAFSSIAAGIGYGAKGAAKLGKTIAKGRVVRKFSPGQKKLKFYDKHIDLREAVFSGASVVGGLVADSTSLYRAAGGDSYNAQLVQRSFSLGGSLFGFLGGKSLNPIKNIKSNPSDFLASRASNLGNAAGLVALLATEPGSNAYFQWQTVSLVFGNTSLYAFTLPNELKRFDRKGLREQFGISESVWDKVLSSSPSARYHALDSDLLPY